MNRRLRLSAVNLGFGYVLLGIVALVCFAAPLWYAWQVTIRDGRAEIMQEDVARLATEFDRDGAQGLASDIRSRVGLQIAHERMLLFIDPAGRRLAGNLRAWPADMPVKPGTYTITVMLHGQPSRAVCSYVALPGGYKVMVGRDLAQFAPLETRFWYGLSAAIVILMIAGIIGAALIRRALLTRIESIQHTVSAIMQGKLSHRLSAHDGNDELDTLSQTINRMLDQIEQLVHGISNVSNSIAHDLRTPLAELRSRLEELSLTRPPAEETFQEVEAAVADVDRVIRIFNALLRLAEIDTGMRRSGFVPVDLAQISSEIIEFYLPAAELKDIALSLHGSEAVTVAGDPLLLAQAVSNMLENALKYTPAGGNIAVGLAQRNGCTVELSVADNGSGMPDAEKSKATERFFRGDASRGSPGVGLGLSIVEAVARLHGGSLQLVDNHPGLRACMVIESAPASASA